MVGKNIGKQWALYLDLNDNRKSVDLIEVSSKLLHESSKLLPKLQPFVLIVFWTITSFGHNHFWLISRYGSPKTFRRHFHESSDFCFHNVDDDLQPVIPPAGLSTPVYYTKHNSATSDGSVSFDNPAYVNAEDRTAVGYGLASAISRIRNMRSSGPAVSIETTSAHPDAIDDQFVFTNPPLTSDQKASLRVANLENPSQSLAWNEAVPGLKSWTCLILRANWHSSCFNCICYYLIEV